MPLDLSPAALSRAIGGMDAEQSEPSQKDPRGLFKHVGLPALIGGQGLDLATTLYALKKGGYEEANPILGNSPMKIGLLKGATTAGLALLANKVSKNHPKAALMMALMGGAAGAVPGAMNLKTLSK